MDNLNKGKTCFLPDTISREQAKDTGMAIVLICMLVFYFYRFENFLTLSIALLIINMTVPKIYKPLAKLWFWFSNVIGFIMSNLVLTMLFLTLVTPIGVLRRITGSDSLQIKKWKKGKSSVFQIRDHTYQQKDIANPY